MKNLKNNSEKTSSIVLDPSQLISYLTFTCSKSAIETIENGVNYVES